MIASRPPTLLRVVLGTAMAACMGAVLLVSARDRVADGAVIVVEQAAHPAIVGTARPIQLTALFTGLPANDPMLAMQHLMARQMRERIGFRAVIAPASDGCTHARLWRQGAPNTAPVLVLDSVTDRCPGRLHPGAAMQRIEPGKHPGLLPPLSAGVDRHVRAPTITPTRPF